MQALKDCCCYHRESDVVSACRNTWGFPGALEALASRGQCQELLLVINTLKIFDYMHIGSS